MNIDYIIKTLLYIFPIPDNLIYTLNGYMCSHACMHACRWKRLKNNFRLDSRTKNLKIYLFQIFK